jgi:hypothetical protein
MSLVDEVAAQIRTVIADLGYLRDQIDTALHDIERAGQGFAQVGRGTTTDLLPQAVAACGQAAERLVTAMGVIDQARELLWNYLLVITPSMAGPRPATAAPTVSPAVSSATLHKQPQTATRTTTTGTAAGSSVASSVPAGHTREPARYIGSFFEGLHVRTERGEPTDGVLTTTDGQRVAGVYSGRQGPASGGAGLRPLWRQANAAVLHAEGHAAALIRARGLTEATLYVNNQPCSGRMGCDRSLPGLLPSGSTLTVYGPDRFVKVYQGTGDYLT